MLPRVWSSLLKVKIEEDGIPMKTEIVLRYDVSMSSEVA